MLLRSRIRQQHQWYCDPYERADKRTDVVATALYAGFTVEDLTRPNLEYALPFNGVWDPLQVAATSLRRQGL
jgi:hypothetical protein